MKLSARKVVDRFGNIVFRCPLCGHTFYNSKQYTRHLYISHINNPPKKKRKLKKLIKQKELIELKKSQGIELSNYEKLIEIKAKKLGL